MPNSDIAMTARPSTMIDGHPCILLRIACSIELFPQRCWMRTWRVVHAKHRRPRPHAPGRQRHGPGTHDSNGKGATRAPLRTVAEWTGLEPATSGVTGQHSNQLNYHSAVATCLPALRANLASPRGFEPRCPP